MNFFQKNGILFFCLFAIFSLNALAQEEVILTIGDQVVTRGEFERIYRKNNAQIEDRNELKTPSQYMEMFIDFKLKVYEAEKQGLDTTAQFREELSMYREELAQPYLTDITYTDSVVNEAYYRTVNSVRASHILLELEESAKPEDTLAVWNKAISIREEYLSGKKSFADLAVENSQDPSVISNKGDLGYFNAFQMISPFEEAAYNTPVGQVSMPIRTRYGYHLVYVVDKQPSKGEMQVAHIMKMFSNPLNVSDKESDRLKQEIDSIYSLVQKGEDFAELAKKYSDDKRSAVDGGKMQWFGYGQIDPDFSEAAFKLKNNGEVSGVVRTRFGWHIIKRLDHKNPPVFEDVTADLEERIKNDPSKSEHSRSIFVEKLKKEYNFNYNQVARKSFISLVSANKRDSVAIGKIRQNDDRVFFSFADQKFFFKDYLAWLTHKSFEKKKYVLENMDNFVEAKMIEYENSRLEQKYPEFRYLVQEYHDGILLFSIMEKNVWDKAIEDTLGLEKFYAANPEKFPLGEHFDGLVIRCKDQAVRDSVEMFLHSEIADPKVIEEQLNRNGETRVEVEKGRWERGDSKIVDFYVWNGSKPLAFDESLQFIYGNKMNSGFKTLDEAKGLYISAYQDYLESEWVKQLRSKYKTVVNKKVLKRVPKI